MFSNSPYHYNPMHGPQNTCLAKFVPYIPCLQETPMHGKIRVLLKFFTLYASRTGSDSMPSL